MGSVATLGLAFSLSSAPPTHLVHCGLFLFLVHPKLVRLSELDPH